VVLAALLPSNLDAHEATPTRPPRNSQVGFAKSPRLKFKPSRMNYAGLSRANLQNQSCVSVYVSCGLLRRNRVLRVFTIWPVRFPGSLLCAPTSSNASEKHRLNSSTFGKSLISKHTRKKNLNQHPHANFPHYRKQPRNNGVSCHRN
jgi:hypothetical protein